MLMLICYICPDLHGQVARQVAAALAYLHDSPLGPLVHNDLKPENVLVRLRRTPHGPRPQAGPSGATTGCHEAYYICV